MRLHGCGCAFVFFGTLLSASPARCDQPLSYEEQYNQYYTDRFGLFRIGSDRGLCSIWPPKSNPFGLTPYATTQNAGLSSRSGRLVLIYGFLAKERSDKAKTVGAVDELGTVVADNAVGVFSVPDCRFLQVIRTGAPGLYSAMFSDDDRLLFLQSAGILRVFAGEAFEREVLTVPSKDLRSEEGLFEDGRHVDPRWPRWLYTFGGDTLVLPTRGEYFQIDTKSVKVVRRVEYIPLLDRLRDGSELKVVEPVFADDAGIAFEYRGTYAAQAGVPSKERHVLYAKNDRAGREELIDLPSGAEGLEVRRVTSGALEMKYRAAGKQKTTRLMETPSAFR